MKFRAYNQISIAFREESIALSMMEGVLKGEEKGGLNGKNVHVVNSG